MPQAKDIARRLRHLLETHGWPDEGDAGREETKAAPPEPEADFGLAPEPEEAPGPRAPVEDHDVDFCVAGGVSPPSGGARCLGARRGPACLNDASSGARRG